ncbi:MAG TPA: hypothetical protein VFX19_03355 [Dehalococcoidia bacterium]|jgi:hypothetical protein|nr:hypothetical protein [Dehalococcoidia bacterium]
MGALVSLLLAIPVVGAVVLLVRRMLRRHVPTDAELERLARTQTGPVEYMMLPTLTTEMSGKVARDPEFELDAMTVRNRQGF